MVRRSSLRWVIDQMADEEVQQVKQAVLKTLADDGVDRAATNVIYAVAKKDSSS